METLQPYGVYGIEYFSGSFITLPLIGGHSKLNEVFIGSTTYILVGLVSMVLLVRRSLIGCSFLFVLSSAVD